MILESGLTSEDFKAVSSKLKRANLEQLTFITQEVESEIIKRCGQ